MPNPFNRRSFILGSAVALMTAGARNSAFAALSPPFFNQGARPMGLQLYTLGELRNNDLDAVFAQVAAIGYRDIELPGLYGQPPAAIKAAADRAGLTISSIHLNAPGFLPSDQLSFSSEPQRIGDNLGALGVSSAVMPLAPIPPAFNFQGWTEDVMQPLAQAYAEAGPEFWKQTAELLNTNAAKLRPFGISLGYHNHNIEFAPVGDTTGWDILTRETDPDLIKFEVDTGWLAAAGIDPAELLRQHSGRVEWLHIKDLKQTPKNYAFVNNPTEVGSGILDWTRILPAAAHAGVKHFYVEQEPPFEIPQIEAIAKSYQYLAKLGLEV